MNEIYFYAAETFFDCFIMVLCKQTYTCIEAKRGFSGTLRLLRLKQFFLDGICNLTVINIIDPHDTIHFKI